MSAKYLCPKCRISVNVGDQIVLIGKTKNGLKGVVVLKSELGNYTTLFSDDFPIFEGNKLSLSCPLCRASLSTRKQKNIAHLKMIDQEDNEATIFFSQIYGEKCTFKIEGKQVTQSFGDDKDQYKPDWLIEEL
ncbi:MAG: hypothetical protein PF517_02560 [Salinivirgaceae bacterium]|jgi:uncharacterized protein YbaR (Trm112 family)|nr:hypothetical protein [Salinivirgaceae bacterium]